MFSPTFSKERPVLMGLILLFVALLFLDVPGSHLMDPDETRYAEIPREMLAADDLMTFRLNGSRYFEKPPLLYWMNAASMSVLGENPSAVRLAVRLACVGITALLIGEFGLWAGLIYISSLLPFVLGRINLTDGVVSFFLTMVFLGLYGYLKSESSRVPIMFQVMMGVGAALALLAKGLISLVLPGMVFLLWAGLTGQWNKIGKVLFSWVPVIFLAIAIPAYGFIEKYNPGFVHFFIIREHFQRYSSDIHDRTGHVLYFVPVFIAGLFPWTILFFSKLKPFLTWDRNFLKNHAADLFLVLWCFVPLVFFSFSHSKLIPYILPVFPAAAGLLGKWISINHETLFSRTVQLANVIFFSIVALGGIFVGAKTQAVTSLGLENRVITMSALLFVGVWAAYLLSKRNARIAAVAQALTWGGVLFLLVLTAPTLARDYTSWDMATNASQIPSAKLVSYRTYPHGFAWAMKSPIIVADFKGELASDGILSPALYWTQDEFWRRWNSEERILGVFATRGSDDSREHLKMRAAHAHVIAQNHRHILIANFDPDKKKP